VASIGLNDSNSPADIDSNSLNVTRVGGTVAFIAAILAGVSQLFPVSTSDPTALRITIPAVEGAIVIGALLTAAIIISADIRGRAVAAASALPLPAGLPLPAATPGTAPAAASAAGRAGPVAAGPVAAAPVAAQVASAASSLQSYKTAISAAANEFDAMDFRDITVVQGLVMTLAALNAPPGKQVQQNQAQSLAKGLEDSVAAATNMPEVERNAAFGRLEDQLARLKALLAALGS
jgi:hypothetical protein